MNSTNRPSVMSAPQNVRDTLQLVQDAIAAHEPRLANEAAEELARMCKVWHLDQQQRMHNRGSDSEPFTMEWAAKIVYGRTL